MTPKFSANGEVIHLGCVKIETTQRVRLTKWRSQELAGLR